MHRNESSPYHQPADDEALVYSFSNLAPLPAGTFPAPHVELLASQNVAALSRFLAVIFRPQLRRGRAARRAPSYPVRIHSDRAIIVVDLNVSNAQTCTVPRLIQEAPQVNRWLREWAASGDRTPTRDPEWAVRLGLDEREVEAVALGIANRVAQPDALTIAVRDSQSNEAAFKIPARAELRAPTQSAHNASQRAAIRAIEHVRTGVTSGGETIVANGDLARMPEEGFISLDPASLRRTTVLLPRRITVCKPPIDRTKSKNRDTA